MTTEDRIRRALGYGRKVHADTGEVTHDPRAYDPASVAWCECDITWLQCIWCESAHEMMDHREIDMPKEWHEWMSRMILWQS